MIPIYQFYRCVVLNANSLNGNDHITCHHYASACACTKAPRICKPSNLIRNDSNRGELHLQYEDFKLMRPKNNLLVTNAQSWYIVFEPSTNL